MNSENTKYTKTGVYTYNSEDILFNFATTLSISDKLSFVNSVVDTLVSDGRYNAILRDIIFDLMLIKTMTDIDTNNLNLDNIENFLSETNIIDIIKANAAPNLIDSLSHSVDLSIEYITGIHKNPLSEALASLMNTIEKKVNEVDLSNLDNMMEVVSKFTEMKDDFTVDNVVNAYMNSDMHKKNLKEIAEAKKVDVDVDVELEVVEQED